MKKVLKFFSWSLGLFLIISSVCSLVIEFYSVRYLTYNLYALPHSKTAIVLGTSRRLSSGVDNLYFTYRIEAAARLFHKGVVRKLILSGDNRENNYNEPKQMQKALMRAGVPDSCLVMDYAGLRTFDSMVRCQQIFGQDTIIVVSQKFQNARAVFIGRQNGMTAYGYNADKVENQNTIGIRVREFFSRVKCVLDIYLLDTRPRHLGEKIEIG